MLTCPSCDRRYFLPRAGPFPRRREAPPRTRPAARLGRRWGAGGAGTMSGNGRAIDDAVAARRRTNDGHGVARDPARPGPRPDAAARRRRGGVTRRNAAISAASGSRRSTSTCSTSNDRRILCACATCWAQRSGDPNLRPTGSRVVWLEDFSLPDELWARLEVPIGLSFFMYSSSVEAMVAMYPSPAGATESELKLDGLGGPARRSIRSSSRSSPTPRRSSSTGCPDQPSYVIAPIDECYAPRRRVKVNWEGISGGDAIERAVPTFFERLRQRSGERTMSEAARRSTSAALRIRGRRRSRPTRRSAANRRPREARRAGLLHRGDRRRAIDHAAAPTLGFGLRLEDDSGREVFMAGPAGADPDRAVEAPLRRCSRRRS